jgi:hypothetical protein
MAALAKANEGFLGCTPVLCAEGNRDHFALLKKARKGGMAGNAKAVNQHNRRLDQSRRTNGYAVCPAHFHQQAGRPLLAKNRRNYG